MLKIEDLKEGEIYLYDYNWLSKFPKDGALNINTRDWREEKKWWRILNIKPATPEQKHWFKECEKANKFIPYEEAMKTFKKENESLVGRYVKCIKSGSGLNIGNHFKIINWRQGLFDKGFIFNGFQNEFYNYFELMPEGWTPEQENKPQFEVGKWYTHQKWSPNSYIKFSSIRDYNSVFELERISQGSYKGRNTNWSISYEHTLEEAKMEVVSQFLPDNHPDKITKQENYEYGVVHCKTQEEWDFVISKLKNSPGLHRFKNLDTDNDKGNCIHFVDDKSLGFCWKNYYLINKGYKIYSFEEWCEKFGHKPDFMNKQEEYKVGDWVLLSSNAGGWGAVPNQINNKILQITAIDLNDNPTSDSKGRYYFGDIRTIGKKIVRKALPHEIPQETNNSIPEYVECITDKFGSIHKNVIYKLTSNSNKEWYWLKGINIGSYSSNFFKASSKEAYEAQLKQNSVSNNDIIEVGDEVKFIGYTKHNSMSKWYKPSEIFSKSDEGIIVTILDISGEDGGAYKVKTPRGYTALRRTAFKLIKKASQTTNYIHEKQVDSVSPQVNTDLILFKKAKKAKEIDILPVQSPIFVNQKVNNKKQLLILN